MGGNDTILRRTEHLCNQAKELADEALRIVESLKPKTVNAERRLKWTCPDCQRTYHDPCHSTVKPATVTCEYCEKAFTVNR
jgi:hypothetical protein